MEHGPCKSGDHQNRFLGQAQRTGCYCNGMLQTYSSLPRVRVSLSTRVQPTTAGCRLVERTMGALPSIKDGLITILRA